MIAHLIASALIACAVAGCSTTGGSSSAGSTTGSRLVLPTITVVPPNGTSSELDAVWCGAPTRCIAAMAGETVAGSATSGLFEVDAWNGHDWAAMETGRVAGAPLISAITCPSARSCVAVGADDGAALTMSWDGSRWSVLANPASRSAGLADVACSAPGQCTAVGLGPQGVLIETLVAGKWTIVANPGAGRTGDPGSELTGIECLTAGSCIAVGYREVGIGSEPLVESWNARAWALTATPTLRIVPSSPGGSLDSVQCHATSACVAIGHQGGAALVESSDGAKWSITQSASAPGIDSYSPFTLSCVGPDWCMAAGAVLSSGMHPLLELAQQDHWAVLAGPKLSPASYGAISSLSCASRTFCLAAGWRSNQPSTPGSSLLEMWDGADWAVVPAP